MDNQTAFDRVATHLLAQNEKATDNKSGHCVYRAPDGRKCAIGALIPDDKYTSEMEGKMPEQLHNTWGLFGNEVNIELLDDLQDCHDNFQVSEWRDTLYNLASVYDLTANF